MWVLTVTFRPACRAFTSRFCASFSTLLNVLDCVSSCCLSSMRICSFCSKAFASPSCKQTSSQDPKMRFRSTSAHAVPDKQMAVQCIRYSAHHTEEKADMHLYLCAYASLIAVQQMHFAVSGERSVTQQVLAGYVWRPPCLFCSTPQCLQQWPPVCGASHLACYASGCPAVE